LALALCTHVRPPLGSTGQAALLTVMWRAKPDLLLRKRLAKTENWPKDLDK
jgi:hypothetical protein